MGGIFVFVFILPDIVLMGGIFVFVFILPDIN
jgi:hypothetical protein